ncbi:MAG: rhodanese-like domain-containing protein [Campylobacterota bacterium]|nr:rhodanese-like domain-containing protein [Campylobacterota bacterium]
MTSDNVRDDAHLELEDLAQRRAEVYLTEQFKSMINEATTNIPQIEPEDLYVLDEKLLLIDVREPEEFSSGYINAHNHLTIPRGKLEFAAIKKIAIDYGHDTHIVTYCYKGPRGALAACQLKKMGFKNVENLNGGLLNWLEKGNTIKSYLGELTLTK